MEKEGGRKGVKRAEKRSKRTGGQVAGGSNPLVPTKYQGLSFL